MATNLVYIEVQQVRTRTGRIHERYRLNKRWLVDERCNLDDTEIEVLTVSEMSDQEQSEMCGHCFPVAQ